MYYNGILLSQYLPHTETGQMKEVNVQSMLISLTWSHTDYIGWSTFCFSSVNLPYLLTLSKKWWVFQHPIVQSCTHGTWPSTGCKSSKPHLLLKSISNSFSTAWKTHVKLARFIFFPPMKNSKSLLMPAREESQTIHYLGFLDMTAQTTWPHSSFTKRQESLTVSIILFDLSRHIFFFF